jgi:hypothetical protein
MAQTFTKKHKGKEPFAKIGKYCIQEINYGSPETKNDMTIPYSKGTRRRIVKGNKG